MISDARIGVLTIFLSFLSLPLFLLNRQFPYIPYYRENQRPLEYAIIPHCRTGAISHADLRQFCDFRIQTLDELLPLLSQPHTRIPCFPFSFMHSAARFTQPMQWSMITESVVMTFSLSYRDRSTSRRI